MSGSDDRARVIFGMAPLEPSNEPEAEQQQAEARSRAASFFGVSVREEPEEPDDDLDADDSARRAFGLPTSAEVAEREEREEYERMVRRQVALGLADRERRLAAEAEARKPEPRVGFQLESPGASDYGTAHAAHVDARTEADRTEARREHIRWRDRFNNTDGGWLAVDSLADGLL